MKKIVIVFLALFLNGCSLFVTGDNLGREQGKITKTRSQQGAEIGTHYFGQPLFVFF